MHKSRLWCFARANLPRHVRQRSPMRGLDRHMLTSLTKIAIM